MNVLVLQPPFTQLNTPYPSGAYLSAFFKSVRTAQKSVECETAVFFNADALESVEFVQWLDLGNMLYHEIFCANGLKKIFVSSEAAALKTAQNAEKGGDHETAFCLRRFIMQQDAWITRIEDIQALLCAGKKSGRELCHEFVRSAHMPRGRRMERFLSEMNDVTPDNARFLATLAIEDLADFITAVYDSHFEIVRYASSLAESESSFSDTEKALFFPIVTDFFEPLFESIVLPLAKKNGDWLVCISVPFPGTFPLALACARTVKRILGERVLVLFGGGYINTELRTLAVRQEDSDFFSYSDLLVYDRGYAALLAILRTIKKDGLKTLKTAKNHVVPNADLHPFIAAEDYFTRTLIPDYTDIDFSQYPRMSDTTNAMHRLWSDGAWLKAYLAHGCYWHRCFFCDTALDYVKSFRMVQTERLYKGLIEQAAKSGVYGVHFVDEAAPPRSLLQFALLNCCARKNRLTFWGNIRFEKTFSRQTADLLAYGGLTGVTGGIEIAAANGLQSIEKGIALESLVAACAAFKEAGILVHAYMIFGYYDETPQTLIDSMETLRQLFKAGLLDSAFWHKFMLTRHSRLYDEWKNGLQKNIYPQENRCKEARFAENDLRFAGETESIKYAQPLDYALYSWMRGKDLQKSVQKWFPFSMPKPTVSGDCIEKLIARYEKLRDTENAECAAYFTTMHNSTKKRSYWLGGKPVCTNDANGMSQICWLYMDDAHSVKLPQQHALCIARALYDLRPDSTKTEKQVRKIEHELCLHKFPAHLFAGKGLLYL